MKKAHPPEILVAVSSAAGNEKVVPCDVHIKPLKHLVKLAPIPSAVTAADDSLSEGMQAINRRGPDISLLDFLDLDSFSNTDFRNREEKKEREKKERQKKG